MHFYTQQGEPRHYVPMTKDPSQLRPSRTTDAKKHSWVPSVTTILDIFDKPALANWKVDQHLQQAYELDPSEYTTPSEYMAEIKRLTREEMDKAPQAGTDMHEVIEAYFKGNIVPVEHTDLMLSIRELIEKETGWKATDFESEVYFAHPMGFAGQTDLRIRNDWVIDFKTKQTADKFKPGKMVYVDHERQLAAYRGGLEAPTANCANLFICLETGELDFHIHKEEKLQCGWGTFKDALSIWKRERFDSAF